MCRYLVEGEAADPLLGPGGGEDLGEPEVRGEVEPLALVTHHQPAPGSILGLQPARSHGL